MNKVIKRLQTVRVWRKRKQPVYGGLVDYLARYNSPVIYVRTEQGTTVKI